MVCMSSGLPTASCLLPTTPPEVTNECAVARYVVWLTDDAQESGLHGCSRADAGAGDRRQHRHLLGRQRCAAQTAALQRPGATLARAGIAAETRLELRRHRGGGNTRLYGRQRELLGDGRLHDA